MEKQYNIIPGELAFVNRILVPQCPDILPFEPRIYKAINNKDEIYFSFFFYEK